MNRLLAMVTEVSLEPEERTSVLALIDCAEEEMNLSHNAAVRYAVGVRRNAKFDALAAQALKVIAVDSKYYIDIREEARDHFAIPRDAYIALTVKRQRDRMFMLQEPVWNSLTRTYTGIFTCSFRPQFVLRLRDLLDQLEEESRVNKDGLRAALERRRRGGQHAPA